MSRRDVYAELYIVLYPVLGTVRNVFHVTLADLIVRAPTRFLLEEFRHSAISTRKLLIHLYPPRGSQVLIYAE